jgi:hypothetical protein
MAIPMTLPRISASSSAVPGVDQVRLHLLPGDLGPLRHRPELPAVEEDVLEQVAAPLQADRRVRAGDADVVVEDDVEYGLDQLADDLHASGGPGALDPRLHLDRREPAQAAGILAAQHGIELSALPPVLDRPGPEEERAREVVRVGEGEGLGAVEHLVHVLAARHHHQVPADAPQGPTPAHRVQAGHPVPAQQPGRPGRDASPDLVGEDGRRGVRPLLGHLHGGHRPSVAVDPVGGAAKLVAGLVGGRGSASASWCRVTFRSVTTTSSQQ